MFRGSGLYQAGMRTLFTPGTSLQFVMIFSFCFLCQLPIEDVARGEVADLTKTHNFAARGIRIGAWHQVRMAPFSSSPTALPQDNKTPPYLGVSRDTGGYLGREIKRGLKELP
mmetsp:Transcript_28766/g.56189  ORF Transcript_28766/g.56189 Transcript_28766/m.56189 type:complete len:113 (+) Transcript_28766:101-439(+)